MKKIFFAAALAALVMVGCSKKEKAVEAPAVPVVEQAAPVVEKVLSFTEKTVETLQSIQSQLSEASTKDAVKAVSEKLNAVAADVKANAANLTDEEKATLNALYTTIATACQAKEAVTK